MCAWRSDTTRQNLFVVVDNYDKLIVFDVETTGLNAKKDRIIQISAIKYQIENGLFLEESKLDLYINPERTLPPKIVEITGITDAVLWDQPTEMERFPEINDFFKGIKVVVGHNSKFDIRFLKELYARQGLTIDFDFELDTLEMARDLVDKSEIPNYKLGTLAELYGVDKGLTFHNSLDDVVATASLLAVFYTEYVEKESLSKNNTVKLKARVLSVRYWQGYRGHSRIYVNTDRGTFFFDTFSKEWDGKKDNVYNLDEIDMEGVRLDAWRMTGAKNELEFARFKG